MVDPGAAQALLKQLNRWYRSRARPRGTIDHFYRGTRMSYTATYRGVVCCLSLFLLAIAGALFFVPDLFADKSKWFILGVRVGGAGMVLAAILLPLHALREFTVVNDDGLIKGNLFGGEARMGWQEIASFRINPDDNGVVFMNRAKGKLTMSLSYDGWRDFQEMAARHLDPSVYWQFTYALANVDAKGPMGRSTGEIRLPKWLSFGRKR
jgi:hypothetical protein